MPNEAATARNAPGGTAPARNAPARNAPASPGKEPRTARGRETLRRLLDAAAAEFGERGYHEASVSGITRRAETALGSFYTYFDSKDAIYWALVNDMSMQVATVAAAGITPGNSGPSREREALAAYLGFVREHKEIYRIIDEAEFADPAAFRAHYETTAKRIETRLDESVELGTMQPGNNELRAWAVMGMNVFLGLRYGIWSADSKIDEIAAEAEKLLRDGVGVD